MGLFCARLGTVQGLIELGGGLEISPGTGVAGFGDEGVRQAGQGGDNNLTEEELLAAAKDIAVERHNKLISRLKLAEVKQG